MIRTEPPATTIDDVLARLDRVIERCVAERSKLGYFAMLYRNVTVRVRDAIAAGRFEDGARMERLDVFFANRYLDAIARYWDGRFPTRSWSVAFRASRMWAPIILQHLVLGMNAHVNLDLGIAAAQAAPGAALPALQRDFNEITVVLNEMILDVQARIERVSPWFALLDRAGGRTDEQIAAFAIGLARDRAWQTAQGLAAAAPEQSVSMIDAQDQLVAHLGQALYFPGTRMGIAHLLIRLRELNDVPRVIETLRM